MKKKIIISSFQWTGQEFPVKSRSTLFTTRPIGYLELVELVDIISEHSLTHQEANVHTLHYDFFSIRCSECHFTYYTVERKNHRLNSQNNKNSLLIELFREGKQKQKTLQHCTWSNLPTKCINAYRTSMPIANIKMLNYNFIMCTLRLNWLWLHTNHKLTKS